MSNDEPTTLYLPHDPGCCALWVPAGVAFDDPTLTVFVADVARVEAQVRGLLGAFLWTVGGLGAVAFLTAWFS